MGWWTQWRSAQSLAVTSLTVAAAFFAQWGRFHGDGLAAGLVDSLLFAVALLGALLVHELGHRYGAARMGLRVSWPLFLPFPMWLGTLGALIRLEGVPRDRSSLLVLGLSGPLAGTLAALGLMLLDLWLYGPGPLRGAPLQAPLLWQGCALVVGAPDASVSAARPLALAGWVMCLVHSLNLLPIGQLDGGHVFRALAPDHHRLLGWMTTGALLAAGWLWVGWPVWAAVVHLASGVAGADTRESTGLDERWWRGGLVLWAVLWGLCLLPVPLTGWSLP